MLICLLVVYMFRLGLIRLSLTRIIATIGVDYVSMTAALAAGLR